MIHCTSCGASSLKYYAEKNKIDLYHCKSCRSLVADCDEPGEDFYHTKYFRSDTDYGYSLKNRRSKGVEPKRRIKFMRSISLDFGAGEGHFLNELIANDIKAYGVERSDYAREVSKESYDLAMHDSVESLGENLLGQIHSISLIEVVEHVKDPNNLISNLVAQFKNFKRILITTPNVYYLQIGGIAWEQIKPPEHINLISTRALRSILICHSFKVSVRYYHSLFLKFANENYGSYSNRKHKYFWVLTSFFRLLDPVLSIILPRSFFIGVEIYGIRD